jgi:hypothetical protein
LLDQPVSGDATLEEAVESFLGSLPQAEQAWAALGERYRVELLCDLFIKGTNQGFELSPRVLELLGRRRITLGVDIFCEPDESQRNALQERLGMRKSEG